MTTQKNNFKLVLNAGHFTTEDGDSYIGYGFTAYRTDPLQEIYSIEDLSTDRTEIENLIRLILDNDVSVTHFQDLIDDFCI